MAIAASTEFDDADIDLSQEDHTVRYFSGLQTRAKGARRSVLDAVEKSVKLWAQRSSEDDLAANLLQSHLPTILRLSCECPFGDVRDRFKKLLSDLRVSGIAVPQPQRFGPTAFIPHDEVVLMDDSENAEIFVSAFLNDCRVSHMVQLMSYHQEYMDCFVKVHHFVMRGDGPLPYHWRNYIATMAAARHQCGYLVSLQQVEFLEHSIDKEWLRDLNQVPQKLRNLLDINKLLAHQPWKIHPDHIRELLKSGPDSWSISELVHAVVLLTHIHALSGFALGCGLNPEIDSPIGHKYEQSPQVDWPVSDSDTVLEPDCSSMSSSVPSSTGTVINALVGPHRAHSDSNLSLSPVNGFDQSGTLSLSPPSASVTDEQFLMSDLIQQMKLCKSKSELDLSAEDNEERFETESLLSAELSPPIALAQCPCPEWISRYIDDPLFGHEDFSLRGEYSGIATYRLHEYSWEDHGFSLVSRLYSDIGPLLDEKFKCASTFTYNSVGDQGGVDTTPFRRAVWNYIHCIKGIFHDDYNYSEVNRLLPRPLKTYAKNVTCFPERVTYCDFFNCLREFRHSERVHVNIILMEARFQAELLYALRALNRYITLSS